MPAENKSLEQKLMNAIEKAISQLNVQYLHTKVKVTQTEYDEELKKPINEIVKESEQVEKVKCEYDISKIKILTELWLKLRDKDTGNSSEDEQDYGFGVVILPEREITENSGEEMMSDE